MEASLTQGQTHFSTGCGFMVGLSKPKLCTRFEASVVAEILKESPEIRGAPLVQSHTHFFFYWNLMMDLGKPQLHAKFEVAGFIRYGNREFVFKFAY